MVLLATTRAALGGAMRWRATCFAREMTTTNQPNENGTIQNPRTEERSPDERRADKGPRRAGLWGIVIGVLILGVVLVAIEFSGRDERERNDPPADEKAAPAIAPR